MPHEKLKRHLEASARKKGIEEGSERWNAYVYGTVAKMEKEGKVSGGHDDDHKGE